MTLRFEPPNIPRVMKIRIYYVTRNDEKASQLSSRIAASSHSIEFQWINPSFSSQPLVLDGLPIKTKEMISIVIFDCMSLGRKAMDLFFAIRDGMSHACTEYVFDEPGEHLKTIVDLRLPNVTIVKNGFSPSGHVH